MEFENPAGPWCIMVPPSGHGYLQLALVFLCRVERPVALEPDESASSAACQCDEAEYPERVQ